MTRARDLADIIGPNGDLVVTGDLQVTGTTTTVNSTTVEIADNNILLGSGATTNAQNTGAGLSVLLPDASPDEFATLVYTTSSDSWSFNKNVGIGTTAPGESLHLRAAAPAIRFEDTDVSGVNQIYSNGSEFVISADQSDLDAFSKITFLVDGDPKASIYDSGTLAIGSGASSNYVLTTNYDANATFSNAVSDFTQMWQNSGVNMLGVAGADDLTVRLAVNNGYVLAFNNGVTEAFRITTAGNIEAPSASSGNFEIGIEDNATDTFRTSAKGLILKGNDAFTGGSPQQASAGGDVEVRAGYGVDNTGLGIFAGDLTLSGGIASSGNNSGAGQIFLKTNNTEVLTVSRDQKVGIGTTNPAEPLTISYFDKDPGIQLERGDGVPATLRIDHNSIRTLTNTDFQIFTNGNNPQIFLDQSNGRVGVLSNILAADGLTIGTAANGNCELDLSNTGATGTRWRFSSASSGNLVIQNKTDTIDAITILDNGNVGIGSISTSHKLDVLGQGIRLQDTNGFGNIAIGASQWNTTYPYYRVDSFPSDGTGYYWAFAHKKSDGTKTVRMLINDTNTPHVHVINELKVSAFTSNELGGTGNYPTFNSNVILRQSGVSYLNGGNVGIGVTNPQAKFQINEKDTTDNNAVALFYGDKSGRIFQRQLFNGNTNSSETIDILSIDSYQSANTNIFVNVKLMMVNPSNAYAKTIVLSAFKDNGGSSGTGTTTTLASFGTPATDPTLSWSGDTLQMTTPAVAFLRYSMDVEYIAYDGATVTIPTTYYAGS